MVTIEYTPLAFWERVFGRSYYLAILKGISSDYVCSDIFFTRKEAKEYRKELLRYNKTFDNVIIIKVRMRTAIKRGKDDHYA